MKHLSILILFAVPLFARASLYDDRAKAAAVQQESEWSAIPARSLLKSNVERLARVKAFVTHSGGSNTNTTCAVNTVDCQFNGSSTGCHPTSDSREVPIAAVDPNP